MKRKSIFVLAFTLVLSLFASANVKAATGLSADEQAILAKLKAGVEVNGKLVQVPESYINQAENEFLKNDVDVTAEQAAVINNKIDEVADIMKAENISSLDALKNSDSLDELVRIVKEAASVVDYTVAFDAANGTVTVSDADGNDVFTTKNVINQTGYDMTQTVIIGGGLVTLLAACVVIANKKKLFAESMEG